MREGPDRRRGEAASEAILGVEWREACGSLHGASETSRKLAPCSLLASFSLAKPGGLAEGPSHFGVSRGVPESFTGFSGPLLVRAWGLHKGVLRCRGSFKAYLGLGLRNVAGLPVGSHSPPR